jgi:4-amino-4-deoxy-L-arabinose transferase-like glycosyltransferase
MYEVWLGLNILYEMALTVLPALAILALAWLVSLLIRRQNLRQAKVGMLLGLAVLVGVVATLTLPTLTKSSLSDMTYWVDWATLLGVAAGFGVATAVLLWPFLTRPKSQL